MATVATVATASAERRAIGGVVGGDAESTWKLHDALGFGALLLTPDAPFVGEWDAGDAFAVAWTDGDGALHLARDPIGHRSLFYAVAGKTVAFASTVRALVASGIVPAQVDTHALPAYLSYGYVPGRATLVEHVREVLPGEHVTVTAGRVESERFFELPAEDEPRRTDDEYAADLRAELENAVSRCLPRSGPVAATLSGGIDSSAVVALAAQLHDDPIAAFSVAFGRGLPNELEHAALVARRCGIAHHVVDLTARSVIDRFDSTLGSLSTPIGEPLTVANALLFEAAAGVAPIVLNGEGGDPCFGGPKNVPMLLRELYGCERERGYLQAHKKCFDELALMLTPEAFEPFEPETPLFDDRRWPTLVNRLTATNVTLKGAHHILPKVDHLSRAAGVLGRSPLFDVRVVEAALRMPADLKLRGAVEKYVLKLAVGDLVPAEIVARRKSGMRVPIEAWLEGRFGRFARERLLDGLAPYGLFRREYLEQLVDGRVPRRAATTWLLLSLEAWLRTVLAR